MRSKKTLADARTLLRTLIDEPYVGYYSNSALNTLLNNAYDQATSKIRNLSERYYETTATLTLVVGQNYVSLPADFFRLMKLEYTDGGLLHLDIDSLNFDPTISAIPGRFVLRGDTLLFDAKPTAADTLTLTYVYVVDKLTNDTDEIDLPIGYETIIAYGAAITIGTISENSSQSMWAEFKNMEKEMLSAVAVRQEMEPRRTRIDPGDYQSRNIYYPISNG